MALIENIASGSEYRVEEAEGYHRLMSEFDYTQDVWLMLLVNPSHLANTLRLLNLLIKSRICLHYELSMSQVRPLIGMMMPCIS